ncbi:MAG: hypothetical protein O3C68_07885 [Proteobacteria bacterium]|nr:hypothetical protein [Pseudomonadota bacterium]
MGTRLQVNNSPDSQSQQAPYLVPERRMSGIRHLHPDQWSVEEFRDYLRVSNIRYRKQLYQRLISKIRLNQVSPMHLLKFVRWEPNLRLVQQATRDYLAYRSCTVLDEFKGVREIVELLENNQLENPGAVVAGLLSMGDGRINTVLRILRSRLSAADIRQFSRIHSRQLHAASIEFYIDWLFELQSRKDSQRYKVVCAALNLMVRHDEMGCVDDRIDHSQIGLRQCGSLTTVRFEDYLPKLESSFRSLGTLSECRSSTHSMISTWQDHAQIADELRRANMPDRCDQRQSH